MSFYNLARKAVFGLLAIATVGYGWKLYAYQQQRGGLTPPPQVGTTKPSISSGKSGSANQPLNYEMSSLRVGERLSYNVSWADFATAARLELEVVERGIYFGQDSRK